MNANVSNQKFIALTLISFCVLALILGVVQLSKAPSNIKAVGSKESISGTFMGGTGDRLAFISLEGMISEDLSDSSVFQRESTAMKARRLLYYAAKDTNVKGVLLRINSPGGTVGMSQELYDAVSEVRKHKPIVVSMGDVAASGGYYTAAAADRILANPGTLTASIGVILQTINAEKLLTDKLGIKAVTVKSGKFKDILSPYRPATEAELSLLQDIIDSSYHQFLEAVLNGRTRDIKDPEVRNNRIRAITAIADGRVVLGSQAVEIGLVDQTGGLEDAKRVLQNLAGERFNISRPDRLTLQEYESTFSIWDFLGLGAVQNLKPKMGAVLTPPESVIPNSIRYANQPLWLMESF